MPDTRAPAGRRQIAGEMSRAWHDHASICLRGGASSGLMNSADVPVAARIATAAHPAGIETQNSDEQVATADGDQPSLPTLAVQVV